MANDHDEKVYNEYAVGERDGKVHTIHGYGGANYGDVLAAALNI